MVGLRLMVAAGFTSRAPHHEGGVPVDAGLVDEPLVVFVRRLEDRLLRVGLVEPAAVANEQDRRGLSPAAACGVATDD